MKQIVLNIDSNGVIQFVYDDELKPLIEAGEAEIRRASHVEPTNRGKWIADLSPVGGTRIGPCATRDEAIASEVAQLNSRLERGEGIQFL